MHRSAGQSTAGQSKAEQRIAEQLGKEQSLSSRFDLLDW